MPKIAASKTEAEPKCTRFCSVQLDHFEYGSGMHPWFACVERRTTSESIRVRRLHTYVIRKMYRAKGSCQPARLSMRDASRRSAAELVLPMQAHVWKRTRRAGLAR